MARIVPDLVSNQTITSVTPSTTVKAAAELMAARSIAAVTVLDGEALAGIMTERDITVRVVARGLDPQTTAVGEVMTRDPDTLKADDKPALALRMMRDRNYRHLPVVDDDGTVSAMVSVRDLYAFVLEDLEGDLRQRDQYIFGEAYGGTA